MKASVKLYIFSALSFILAIFLLVVSIRIGSVSAKPFEATVEKAERADITGYDYFKLSGGYVVPYATVYEVEEPGNNVTEVIYPFVSGAYLEKAHNAYRTAHNGEFDQDAFAEWFQTYAPKPKFYVQANIEKMSESSMFDLMLADSLAKNIEGMRITSFVSVSDKITGIYKQDGITPENSVFITEGENPEQAKEGANVVLIFGCIIAALSLLLFFLGRRNATKEDQNREMMERFK